MAKSHANAAQLRQVLRLFALFGHPIRVIVFQRVARTPQTAGDLAAELPVSRTAIVQHLKLLESAVANAEHNHELVGEELRIESVHADEGPTLKRFRPRAMGRATRIRKRTSHLTITLTPKES